MGQVSAYPSQYRIVISIKQDRYRMKEFIIFRKLISYPLPSPFRPSENQITSSKHLFYLTNCVNLTIIEL